MIRCIVVDDEKIILEELCMLLDNAEVKVEGEYQDPYEALNNIGDINPDAAFLDIEMPGINGIELAKKFINISPNTQIVFVTAYENYALNAFEVSAVHYLLKPVTQQKLDEAIRRIERVYHMSEVKSDSGSPSLLKNNEGLSDKITIKDRDNVFIIKINDIIYIKSENGKTTLVTKKGSYSTRSGMVYWERNLECYGFIRCHRSYIVNLSYVTQMLHILGEYKELVLDYCDANIPISRQKVNSIKNLLGVS